MNHVTRLLLAAVIITIGIVTSVDLPGLDNLFRTFMTTHEASRS